ncbi:MAG: hypothetical protein ACKO2K_12395, partial [Alphaproteobacteria bacterium]
TTSAARAGSSSKGDLKPAAASPGVKGKVVFQGKGGSKARFQVVANKLAPTSPYDVVVGGVKVGSMTSNKGGSAKAKFSTQPKPGKETLLGFDPRGASISIRTPDGDEVMLGDVPEPIVKSSDAGKVACCVPDDDGGAECEDRTPERCALEGGTLAPTDSCLPDPCGGSPDVNGDGESDDEDEGEILCCLPGADAATSDDPEVECEDVSAVECATQGGTVLEATSCDASPCAPSAPTSKIVCCVPDEGAYECEDRTADRCTSLGGTVMDGVADCSADPCAGL